MKKLMRNQSDRASNAEIASKEFINWLYASVNRYAMPDVMSGRIQEDDVEDIFQDSYVHFMGKEGQFDPSRGGWHTWRNKVLRSYYLDEKAKLAHHYYDGRQDNGGCDADVAFHLISSSETDSAIRSADYESNLERSFGTLTSSERSVSVMKYSGYDKKEIMDKLGLSGSSVDRHWSCAQGKIRSYMDKVYSQGL